MAHDIDDTAHSTTPLQTQQTPQTALPPPSPSPSEPEDSMIDTTSTSRRPTEEPPTSTSTSSPAPNLNNNPDYMALQSSLTLLKQQHRQAVEDMHTLLTLKEKALADPAWFQHTVVTGGLDKIVPKQQNVVKCPRVEWEKYGSLGLRLGRELEKPTPMDPMYTGVHLFPPLEHKDEGLL